MIGKVKPAASNGHCFVLFAIDYFTKWVEAASYASVIKNVVARLIKHNLTYCYGIPKRIITNNGTNLNNVIIMELYTQFKIKHHNSSPYIPKINGPVEAANKNIKKIVQKLVVSINTGMRCYRLLSMATVLQLEHQLGKPRSPWSTAWKLSYPSKFKYLL